MSYLGCSVTWRATGSLQCLVLLVHVRESEIDNLESVIVVEQQVLWLEISMADTTLVKILDARNEFPVELGGLLFIESCISDNEIK